MNHNKSLRMSSIECWWNGLCILSLHPAMAYGYHVRLDHSILLKSIKKSTHAHLYAAQHAGNKKMQ